MSDTRSTADIAFIEELARMLNAHDLAEIEVNREYGEDDELHVRLSKASAVVQAPAPAAPVAPAAAPAMASPAPAPTEAASPSAAPENHPGLITSPMVGTVYLQPEPGAAAFAPLGGQVNEGATLLIVEAMKTMNHIPAPKAGKVVQIFVEDGEAVEFGAPLMIIE